MREALKGVFLLVATLFLLCVVTPDLQDYQSIAGCSTFIDDDDFALCSGFTIVCEDHHRTETRLFLPEQACFTPSPFIPASLLPGAPFSLDHHAIEPLSTTVGKRDSALGLHR